MKNSHFAKRFISFVVSICILTCTSISGYAYNTFSYKYKGDWTSGTYFISSTTNPMRNFANTAVSNWKDALSNLKFTESTKGDSPSSRLVIGFLDRGPTGWKGVTIYYDYNSSSGIWSQISVEGRAPNSDYYACSTNVNIYYYQDMNWDPANLLNVIMHEIGHALGLAHTSNISSLMYTDIDKVTTLRKPTSDDIRGVKAVYGW